jgi:hypothetical protein
LATGAALVPVALWLALTGWPVAPGDKPSDAIGEDSASADLERLGQEEALTRKQVLVLAGETSLFEASGIRKEASSGEARAETASLYLPAFFTERKTRLDDALRRLFEALPPGTQAVSSQRFRILLGQAAGRTAQGAGAGDSEAALTTRATLSWAQDSIALEGSWTAPGIPCSFEFHYTLRSGLLFAKLKCREQRAFSASFLPRDVKLALRELTLTAGSHLEMIDVALVDRETEADLLRMERFVFTAPQAVDGTLFSGGLPAELLERYRGWKVELHGLEGEAGKLALVPALGRLTELPPLKLSASTVEVLPGANVRFVRPRLKEVHGCKLSADEAVFLAEGGAQTFSVTGPRLEEVDWGLAVTAPRLLIEKDEFNNWHAALDTFTVGTGSNPLKAARLLNLGNTLREQLKSVDLARLRMAPLALPEGYPDFTFEATNGSLSLPLPAGQNVSGLSLSLSVKGGTVERGAVGLCMGRQEAPCAALEIGGEVATDAAGQTQSVSLKAGGEMLGRQAMKLAPPWVKGLQNVGFETRVEIDGEGSKLSGTFSLTVEKLRLFHEKLADVEFTFPRIGVQGEASLDLASQTLEVTIPKLQVGEVFYRMSLDLKRFAGLPAVRTILEFPDQSCAAFLRSAPDGFAPALDKARVAGSIWFKVLFELDLQDVRKSTKLVVDGDLDRCEASTLGPGLDVDQLNTPDYVNHVTVNGVPLEVDVGPGTGDYATLDQIPSYTKAAAYGTEDLAFYEHHGFRPGLIRRAIILFLERGHFAYGGSTISQQLVKNLFFTRHKTLSRKFQEAVVVWWMERRLTKDKIFELYLNCIEYGPKVWGITRAARTYFGKSPAQLTPIESAFLMGLKPDPAYGYLQYRRGKLNSHWRKNLDRVIKRLLDMGAISKEAYDLAMASPLHFRISGPAGAAAVPAVEAEDRPVRLGQEQEQEEL